MLMYTNALNAHLHCAHVTNQWVKTKTVQTVTDTLSKNFSVFIYFTSDPCGHNYTKSAIQIHSFTKQLVTSQLIRLPSVIFSLFESSIGNMRQSHNETKSERFLFSLRVVTFVFLTRSKSGAGLTLKIAFNVCVGYFGRSRLWTPQKVGPCLVRQGVVFVNRWCRGVARGCRVRGKWHENG